MVSLGKDSLEPSADHRLSMTGQSQCQAQRPPLSEPGLLGYPFSWPGMWRWSLHKKVERDPRRNPALVQILLRELEKVGALAAGSWVAVRGGRVPWVGAHPGSSVSSVSPAWFLPRTSPSSAFA